MLRKLRLLIPFSILFTSTSYACINHYVIDGKGKEHIYGFEHPTAIRVSYRLDSMTVQRVEWHPTGWNNEEQFKYISNYCASLIKLGRFKETIPVLKKLLMNHPDEYEINANLAVALELDGQLETALTYLKKSISMRPDAHDQSEWFHINVLEAAIKLQQQQFNLQTDKVLTIPPGNNTIIARQLAYQLQERIPLTRSTNALLSKTIEETADYFNKSLSLEWSVELYAIAAAYSADTLVVAKLWDKINAARTKLVTYHKMNKKSSPSKYLYTKNWKMTLTKNYIDRWRKYIPLYYKGHIVTSF